MTGLPTLTVELEDGSGNFTNDITGYVRRRSFTLSRGWSDENDEDNVQPAELKLELDNRSGEFTLGAANFNGITKDKRIRLSETVGGTTYRRVVGYVVDWPTKWESALANVAIAGITAMDRFARLNRRKLRPVIEYEMLALGPWALYALGEDAGATTAGDTSGNNRTPLSLAGSGTAVAFGTATPGPDGLTGAAFANGQYLSAAPPIGVFDNSDTGTVVVEFSSATPPAATGTLAAWGRTKAQVLSTGVAQAEGLPFAVSGGPNVCDGQVHEIIAWCSGVRNKLYVDGVLVADSGVGSGVVAPATLITVGQGVTGTVWMVGIWTSTLSDPEIAQLASAGVTGFATDRADQRIARLAGYVDIAGADQNLETGQQPSIAAQTTNGKSVLEAMREVAQAEGGGLFIQGDGKLALHNKGHRVLKATGAAAATFTADQVDWDDAEFASLNYLFNTATGSRAGGAEQRSENAVSRGKYEEWPIDRSSALLPTDELVFNELTWYTTMYGEPLSRLSSFTLELLTLPQATVQAALALELGDRVRITGFPAQAPASSIDLIVEGFKEAQTEKSWKLTFNTAPAQLFYAWILGDATYGVLDSTTRLYF